MRKLVLVGISVLGLAIGSVNAEPISEAQKQFNFMSSLKGDWKLSSKDKQEGKSVYHKLVAPLLGTDKVAMSFKIVGVGSTVQENLLPGTKKEMATMYHCDKFKNCNQLVATHFCAKQNQPEMIAMPSISANSVTMDCDKNSALCKSKDGHVHRIKHELSENGNHLKTVYSIFKNGKFKKDSIYHFDRL